MTRIVDIVAVGAILLAFATIADWRYRHPGELRWFDSDYNDHLGAEYDEIAHAIRAGRGFSDPFRTPSGPTAWMAPIMPFTLAGLYWVAGDDRQLVVELVLGIKYAVLLLTGLIVVGEARRLGRQWLGYAVVVVTLATHFHAMFQRTHDEWLVLLVLDLLWAFFHRLWIAPQRFRTAVFWGLFGGFAALTGPVAGTVWAVITLVRWFPRASVRDWRSGEAFKRLTPLGTAAVCSVLMISPWVVRNRLVMGEWIPIKSNGVYELWQAQCIDDDGVVDRTTFASHPWACDGEQRAEYVALGELRFVDRRWPIVRDSIRADVWDYLARVQNRALAATLMYIPAEYEKRQPEWLQWTKRIAFALPFLGFFTILLCAKRPLQSQLGAILWIYSLFLLPYILVSYYERYAMPLMGIKMLIVLYAIHVLVIRVWGWRDGRDAMRATDH